MKQSLLTTFIATVMATAPLVSAKLPSSATEQERLTDKVRHELVMLPFYGVFDQLSFSLEGRKVILTGQVTRPVLSSSAANVVKRVVGVESVENRIEVLPLSPFDDRLRLTLYRTVFGQGSLGRYTLGAIPSVHIIVKNGNVTLTGVVINEMDRNLAGLFANQVSGVFSVTNELIVEKKS